MRVLVPLSVGLVIVASLFVAINSKLNLVAFGGAPDCSKASASASAAAHARRKHMKKGAEEVKVGDTPAASPAKPSASSSARGRSVSSSLTKAGASSSAAAPSASTSAGPPSAGPPSASSSAGAPSASSSAGAPSASTSAGAPSASGSAAPSSSPTSCPSPSGGMNADPNPDCTLIVPANPLSAAGLATPYRMTATNPDAGTCNESNTAQSAFVQATIINPATGKISVYNPLVIDDGARPAARPTRPRLPAQAVVGVWFGYNADNLTLRGTNGSLNQGKCVNGLQGSVFGQFAHCNGVAFFAAANAAIKAGKLTVPALGTAKDGMPCMSTRDFALIDQDQSDNVTTQYLATNDGRIAQSTAANKAGMAGAMTLANPSDNGLLDAFVDPALGCKPWTARNLTDPGTMTTSLAMDELQAAAHQAAPSALIPTNNPMTMQNGFFSDEKTNLYRAGVDMKPLPAGQTPQQYCSMMDSVQAARLQKDKDMLSAWPSPAPDEASNLFTFMGSRLEGSFGNLSCQNYGLTNPVSDLQKDGDVVTGVTFGGNGDGQPCPPGQDQGQGDSPAPSTMPSASAMPSTAPSCTPPATDKPTTTPTAKPTAKGGGRRHGGHPPH